MGRQGQLILIHINFLMYNIRVCVVIAFYCAIGVLLESVAKPCEGSISFARRQGGAVMDHQAIKGRISYFPGRDKIRRLPGRNR